MPRKIGWLRSRTLDSNGAAKTTMTIPSTCRDEAKFAFGPSHFLAASHKRYNGLLLYETHSVDSRQNSLYAFGIA